MHILLVVNGSASSVTARKRVVIQRILSGGHQLEIAETKRRGHATRLALSAARRGLNVVVALGGDGTLNEVANGLVGSDTALALLPGGSTNVFARTLGLHEDPMHAALQLVDALDANSIVPIGLGSANGRYFVFHVGMGWDAALVSEVERRGALKKYLNHALFTYAGLVAFFRIMDRTNPWYEVTATGSSVPGSESEPMVGFQCLCVNSNPYTFVGPRPFNVSPDTSVFTKLSIYSMRSFSIPNMLRVVHQALGSGRRIATNRNIDARREIDGAEVRALRSLPWQVDGDYLGLTDSVSIRFHPNAMRLVVPEAFVEINPPPMIETPGSIGTNASDVL